MLWTEKYRPSKLTDIRGQVSFTTDAYHWVQENNMPNLLLYGQCGTGKTAASVVLAKAILQDNFKNNYVEIKVKVMPVMRWIYHSLYKAALSVSKLPTRKETVGRKTTCCD